jgi:hypothetical protein
MIQTDIPCRNCGAPLIGIQLAKYWRLVCDNHACLLYRERQGSKDQDTRVVSIGAIIPPVVSPLFHSNRIKKRGRKKGKVR